MSADAAARVPFWMVGGGTAPAPEGFFVAGSTFTSEAAMMTRGCAFPVDSCGERVGNARGERRSSTASSLPPAPASSSWRGDFLGDLSILRSSWQPMGGDAVATATLMMTLLYVKSVGRMTLSGVPLFSVPMACRVGFGDSGEGVSREDEGGGTDDVLPCNCCCCCC